MKMILVGLSLAMLSMASPQQADQGRIDRVWKAFQDRIERQNDYWFNKGDFPRNAQLLRFGFEVDPHNYDVATNLGWMLENIEQYDQALAVYIRYKNENPRDNDAPWPEANFYFTRKAYAKVIPLLEPTIAKNPHANSYRTLAHAYERLDMLADSKRTWEAYLKLHPDDQPAKLNLTRVVKKMKEGFSKKS